MDEGVAMKILLIITGFFFLVSTSEAQIKYPEGVQVAIENSYAVCDVLHIEGEFSYNKRDPLKEDYQIIPDVCGTGFQVSATEIITAAHVLMTLEDKLLTFLDHRRQMHELHGMTHDFKVPHGDLTVKYNKRLYSSEGIIFETPVVTFTVDWGHNVPTLEDLNDLQEDLKTVSRHVDTSNATIFEEDISPGRDLARLVLKEPLERDAYVITGEYFNEVGHTSWGVHAMEPNMYSGGIPNISVNTGTIIETDSEKRVPTYELDELVHVDRIREEYLTRNGSSGGPNVDRNGILVGVTHGGGPAIAVLFTEFTPRCNTTLPSGEKFNCERFVISPMDVHEFLDSVRK
jgi:hypothetical protein